MNRTVMTGSKEDFDVVCDLCNSEGQRLKATGHCVDCNVNMCVSCLKFHKKLPSVNDHDIKDGSTMSHSQKAGKLVNRSAEENDSLIDRCPKHPDELIKFYCNSHKNLSCSVCVALEHQSCKDNVMLYIRAVSDNVGDCEELKQIQTDLQTLLSGLIRTQSHCNDMKQAMKESYSKTVADIRKFKKKIIDKLDRFENKILHKASLINDEVVDDLSSTVSTCNDMIREAENMKAGIEKKKSLNLRSRLFISMKTARTRLRDLADEANKLCHKTKDEVFSFQQDEKLSMFLPNLTSLGELIVVSKSTASKARHLHDIKIKCDSDTAKWLISGITVLSDGRLALTDYTNSSVKLVDVTQREVTQQIKLKSNAIDITGIVENCLAVTLYKKRYIQVLSMSPVLSTERKIAVSDVYYGIEHISDKLILVCRGKVPGVHICDMSGTILQKIETDSSGNKLFSEPSRIAISQEHDMLYVSDISKHSVECLTINGKLISTYTSERLKTPTGIALDDYGSVYVCSFDTHTIHQLSPNCQLVKIMLDYKHLITHPYPIAHKAGDLYFGIEPTKDCSKIKTYRLEF